MSLTSASSSDVSVHYATGNGTASAGSDYTATSGTLTIPAGSTSGMIQVPIVGDTAVEADESFFLNLSSPVNASIIDAQRAGHDSQ